MFLAGPPTEDILNNSSSPETSDVLKLVRTGAIETTTTTTALVLASYDLLRFFLSLSEYFQEETFKYSLI
jgi:hypothetical protein